MNRLCVFTLSSFLLCLIIDSVLAEEHFLTPMSEVSLSEALKAIKKVLDDDRTVRTFFHDHVVNSEGFNYCGKPSSCAELFSIGFKESGVYQIHPKPWMKAKPILVYCDMKTEGGGWTVFQRRGDYGEPLVNFTRDWANYAEGFGNVEKEFWLGNDNVHILTNQDNVILRIDLEDFMGNKRFAQYGEFEIEGRTNLYKMRVNQFTGNAGDSFSSTNGLTFVTFDEGDINSCAKSYKGGWWYGKCHRSNLNGRYLRGNHSTFADGVNWHDWLGYHYSLKWTEMKVRPKHFA